MKKKYEFDPKKIINIYEKVEGNNKKKIIFFSFWLETLNFFINSEGLRKLRFIENSNHTLAKNIYFYFSKKKEVQKLEKNFIKKNLLFFFFKLYKPKNLYLDRSDTNVSKINDIISFLYLKYFIGEQKDKINYFSYNLFFERIKKIGLNKILFKFLKENIPKFFFSKSIIKNVNISTYPINFLFEKIIKK